MKFVYTILGTLFGIILTKSEVVSWFRIRKMFLFEEPHMYLIIGSAIAVGIISIQILKRLKINPISKEEFNLKGKEYHKGFIIGGLIFGVGWAITGACPGPIFAQIGAGEFLALITLAGAVAGAFIYHSIKSKLPR
jgi:uncharacterized membrane protein YedE/YeeE